MKLTSRDASQGFTLLETMIVGVVLGILVAIATPTWLSFKERQLLNVARSEALAAIRQAQAQAIQKRTQWQISFREVNGIAQWATHPVSIVESVESVELRPNSWHDRVSWNDLPKGVHLDQETTFQLAKGVRRVQFNYAGQVNGQLGRVTFSTENSGKMKRCVVVSTLLGALRSGENHAKKDGDKTCW
jgi:prepilin-type N-terminal cleavage/methylation domain-containing protein